MLSICNQPILSCSVSERNFFSCSFSWPDGHYSLISGGNVVGGGGGQPLLAGVGTRGVTGEKGTMSKMSVDCGLMEILPACA